MVVDGVVTVTVARAVSWVGYARMVWWHRVGWVWTGGGDARRGMPEVRGP